MAKDDIAPCKKCGTDLPDCIADRGRGRKPKLCCSSCDHSAKRGIVASLLAPNRKPPKNSKGRCFHCGATGRCSCVTVIQNSIEAGAGSPCTQMCKGPNKPQCGKPLRAGGICSCPYC